MIKGARKKVKAAPKFIGRFSPGEAQALGRIFLKITGKMIDKHSQFANAGDSD